METKFKCIAMMSRGGDSTDYFKRWEALKTLYKPVLDVESLYREIAYTPHDYSKHCVNIYNILSSLLIPDEAYNSILNEEHLFILNVAVLFHDITMTYNPENRASHSQEARTLIRTHVSDGISAIANALHDHEALAVSEVIYGHSDIKQGSSVIKKTIEDLPCFDDCGMGGQGTKINIRLLAALLRLADELDICVNRIGAVKPEQYKMNVGSKPHWRKCEILLLPVKHPHNTSIINLKPNEIKIEATGDLENDVELLIEVRNKIRDELKMLNSIVFDQAQYALPGWRFRDIQIDAKNALKDAIDKKDNQNPMVTIETIKKKKLNVVVQNESFKDFLTKWILENNLLKSGHYKINEKTSARDWIDVRALLDNSDILYSISKMFIDTFNQSPIENCVFLGVDDIGLRLASLIGYKTGMPFSYIIPDKSNRYHVDKEKEVLINNRKIILVTDVIVTGNTIRGVLTQLESIGVPVEDVHNVFSIFYRKPSCGTSDVGSNIEDKLVVLNDNLHIEICNNPGCIFKANEISLYCEEPVEA